MKNNDLANTVSYTFGFRVEDFLVKFPEPTFPNRVASLLVSKYKRAKLNENVVNLMDFIYRQTEFSSDIVVEESVYSKLYSLLKDVPFNRVIFVSKPSHVAGRLLVNDITYYVDDDEDRLGLINSPYAVTLSEVSQIIRTLRKR